MKEAIVPAAGGWADIESFNTIDIDCVPWPEQFPYRPQVKASLAHAEDALLIKFNVKEEGIRAVCTEPNGPVWEDSCVEFFVKDPQSRYYYNFETNCIGVGLAGKRISRQEFSHFTPEQMALVKRRASLPCEPIEAAGETQWSVELEIPFAALDCPAKPAELLANFYKCGDRTATPHFVSWSKVLTPAPDFHRPEYFGKLTLIW